MKIFFLVSLQCLVSLFLTKPVFASPIINEVYPKPSTDEKEWVEIYNNSENVVDLTGWLLMDELSTPSIIFQFNQNTNDEWKMDPYTYIVIEIENSKLNNAADGVKLINDLGETIDQLDYVNSELGMSFSVILKDDQKSIILSVPSKGFLNPEPTVSENITHDNPEENNPTNENVLTYYPPLQIYEVMSCPEENNSEWVKINNSNNESVNLNKWIITDEANNQVILSSTETVPNQAFLTIYLKNNILNNSGDTVSLLDPNKNIVDTFEFGVCQPGIPISAEIHQKPGSNSVIETHSTSVSSKDDDQLINQVKNSDINILEEKIVSLKRLNSILSVSNSDKSATAKINNYISKQVVVKDNSLPKTAVISVIIGGATLASSGLFFINHEKN